MKMIWGSQTTHRGDSESAVDPNGHYSSAFLLQTRQEKKVVDEKKKWFEDNKAKYLELKEVRNCRRRHEHEYQYEYQHRYEYRPDRPTWPWRGNSRPWRGFSWSRCRFSRTWRR